MRSPAAGRIAVVLGQALFSWAFAADTLGFIDVPTAAAHQAPADTTRDDPSRGLVHRGLSPGQRGACFGGFRVEGRVARDRCTHGPDPAPPGVDVRERRSVAELKPSSEDSPSPNGGQAASVPCIGDGTSGHRVQVIYAVASDRPDRYASVASLIEGWAADMARDVEDSARETGGFRTLGFVTSSCRLVIDHVVMSPRGDDDLGATADELVAKGYTRGDRDYVVFADASVYCGIGYVGWNFARADTGCWNGETALHELGHNLGAVQLSAPNSSGGWHCTDDYDRMCYSDDPYYPAMRYLCPDWHERLLDCGHDDYFSTSPPAGSFLSEHPEFNIGDSPFMVAEDGQVPVFLPTAPSGYRGPRYRARAYNADDDLCFYAVDAENGARVRLFCVGYRGERSADITGALVALAHGSSRAHLKLVATDRGGGRTFGFTVWKDDSAVVDERDGEVGRTSSGRPLGEPDPLTGWPTFYAGDLEVDLNAPPTAGFTFNPGRPMSAERVDFTSTSSDADGSIATTAWDLDGDGEFDDATGTATARAFATPGTYRSGSGSSTMQVLQLKPCERSRSGTARPSPCSRRRRPRRRWARP
jgi:hypothetical protein